LTQIVIIYVASTLYIEGVSYTYCCL